MKNIKYKIVGLILILMMPFISCKKLIEIDTPVNKIISSAVFKDDATATAAMLGIYIQMNTLIGSIGNSGTDLYPGMSADEIYSTTSISVYDEFRYNAITVTSSYTSTYMWSKAYNLIFLSNSILEGIKNNPAISAVVTTQLKGEAEFIRAYFYFYLCNLFGSVPLITSTDYQANAAAPRSDVSLIYGQIIADLTDAQKLLPETYPSTGKVRINKWTATAFLARVYLYQKNWSKAEEQSTLVINSGVYSIVSDLNKVFLGNSAEAIFQLLPTSAISTATINTYEGYNYIPNANVVPSFSITTYLLNAFSAIDKRKLNWIKSTTVGSTTYYYPFKYQVKTAASITEYQMLFRLGEIYLIRAEALAQQNKLPQAVSDVDIIKSRAGIPLLFNTNPSIGQSALLDEIFAERQRELFVECGHRWLDLKRSGRVDAVLGAIKPTWTSTAALYPIPLTELQRNPALVQNPGY
ncbi:RagB/SusD domain-containing protein [Mucilaginibacter gracilis]|uniref:RagB/SusD domain-containing protein n=1 Tax=Mucilaginibacter gracilis TaxID=423350 RepID=A0A495J6B6_9SPHI|nr:RagB/SusD family nutrient uptake outer membrane protein [Mucilaginibacter gracilis]RKR84417.1 RagB/SusD domain-containing protein [Mucilaginibacter gracilis]